MIIFKYLKYKILFLYKQAFKKYNESFAQEVQKKEKFAAEKEKELLGELWADRSGGKCLFLMIKGPSEISKIGDVVAKAINTEK